MRVTNPKTGEIKMAQIFVACLGASNYTFAFAVENQSLESWIYCHKKAFEFFGGVPKITVPDNLKATVTKACRYDPGLTKAIKILHNTMISSLSLQDLENHRIKLK